MLQLYSGKKIGKKQSKKTNKQQLTNKKMSNKNMVDMIVKNKHVYNNVIMLYIFIQIIAIFWISGIIYYLNKLQKCECYMNVNKSNISYLLFIEYLFLILYVIMIITLVIGLIRMNSIQKGGSGNSQIHMRTVSIITFLIFFVIYGYFLYNVYKIHTSNDLTSKNCDCARNNWLKYLLYIQSLFMLMSLLSIFSTIFFY